MSWNTTTFEKEMFKYFEEINGKECKLYTDYISIRSSLFHDNFFDEIKGQEPNLSDHSARHIQDVFERAYKIIGAEQFRQFNVTEIYCLSLMILFHDVGNIFGRVGHESRTNIAKVYNIYRANVSNYHNERRIITTGASAHAGKTKSGSKDTLRDLKDDNLGSDKINLKELASILRFADELAEGKQRTCSFLIDEGKYKEDSKIYHHYARITEIFIDQKLGRIAITYNIDIPLTMDEESKIKLKDLLLFTFHRIHKLNEERIYTKYHSELLKVFKSVSVVYNFTKDNLPLDFELNQIIFEDTYPVPGEKKIVEEFDLQGLFTAKDMNYDIDKIIESLS
ncbi:hypothetical protein [Chryseobacterium sp. 3008163]|uniref:HD domain-containing protein n=1 Tax=Chryseobacterium sp. 3008163 TaxID=2478663 RepID=UPI000F0CBF46|nr:hypothetical protein [Chryseobacterium sp. 3008163]AYN00100.1 hypothetical protein EAG08_06955 [Chryseobacterium sp. 3008163]